MWHYDIRVNKLLISLSSPNSIHKSTSKLLKPLNKLDWVIRKSPLSRLPFFLLLIWGAAALLSSEVFLPSVHPLWLSLVTHTEDFFHVLVHHVGDADSWNDFEEVGGDAAVQAGHTFMRYDVFELAQHGQLGFTFRDGWKKRNDEGHRGSFQKQICSEHV